MDTERNGELLAQNPSKAVMPLAEAVLGAAPLVGKGNSVRGEAMRTRLIILAVLVLSGLAAPVAFADDLPPITVPTSTVPIPDRGPVSKPTPKPKPQPRLSVDLPAAEPSRPVTRTYTPPTASIAPTKPQTSRPPHEKRAVVKQHKSQPATKKPSTTQPSTKQPGVVGAAQTDVTRPVASPDPGSKVDWSGTALFLVVASILGTIIVLRHRRVRPRQIDVEVIEQQALRAAHFPLGQFNALPVPKAPAPAPAEQLSELGLHPRPAGRTQ